MSEDGTHPSDGAAPNLNYPAKPIRVISIITQVLCISIVGAMFFLRIYVRTHIMQSFQAEDWLLTAGFLFAVGYSIIALVMVHFGGGQNIWEVPTEHLASFGITVYCTMVIYGPCAFCIKASILVFIARIFAPFQRAVLAIHIILGTLIAYYVPVLFLKAVICRPVSKFWNQEIDGECFDQRALILADSVISVLSDAIIFIAPIPLTCNLYMKRKKKAKVAVIFGAGALACICSVIRLVDIVKNGTSPNQTLVFMRVNLWGIAEVYLGIITACMPVMPAFWVYHFGGAKSTGYSRQRPSTNKTIELHSSPRGKRSGSGILQKNTNFGSDENVLIKDVLAQPTTPSRTKLSGPTQRKDMGNNAGTSPTPSSEACMEGEGQITKTVIIEQTYQ